MSERIERLIADFIQDELSDGGDTGMPDVDENLFASGLVDSVGIVRLVAHLQAELSVTVPPPDLVPANFRTIRVMAAYLERLARG